MFGPDFSAFPDIFVIFFFCQRGHSVPPCPHAGYAADFHQLYNSQF